MAGNRIIRREYLLKNPGDELEGNLSGEAWEKIRFAWGYSNPPWGSEVVHHIYNTALGSKNDIWSLLITVSPAAHDFCHKCPKHGVVACVWTKIVKDDFDRESIVEATGRDLINRIVLWRDTAEVVHPYYVELIDKIEDSF